MSDEADEFWALFAEFGVDGDGTPKPLSVRTYEGAGQLGDKYADAASYPGLPQFDQHRLVVGSDGKEITSTAAVYAPLSLAGVFVLDSLVTLADGRERAVVSHQAPDVEGVLAFVHVNLE